MNRISENAWRKTTIIRETLEERLQHKFRHKFTKKFFDVKENELLLIVGPRVGHRQT